MALHMYTSRDLVPKDKEIIWKNDTYFIMRSIGIIDSEIGHKIIEIVEKGKYVDTRKFIGQFDDSAVKSMFLSTGSKTLFNILSDNGVHCFDTLECGDNALQFMLDYLDGYVVISPCFISEIVDESREYYLNNIRIYNDDELTEVLESVKSK